MRLRGCLKLSLSTLVLLLAVGSAQGGVNKKQLELLVEEFNQEHRLVRASHPMLPVNYIEIGDQSFAYPLTRRFSRLAVEQARFRIDGLKVKDRYVHLNLASDRRAKIRLSVYSNSPVDQLFVDGVVPAVLSTLFDFRSPSLAPSFIGNTNSRVVHRASSNHLPTPTHRQDFESIAAAHATGYRACSVCFPKEIVLPFEGYTLLRAQALEDSRTFELVFPVVQDSIVQASLHALGTTVLEGMPIDLVGFDYQFAVVHSAFPNAYSFPTGFVYVTDALLDIIEDPAELEFVLAHEIAHCELLLPPVGSTLPRSYPGEYLTAEYLRKWRRERETIADLLAVAYVSRTRDPENSVVGAHGILSKLQFFHEALPIDEEGEFGDHPSYASRLRLWTEDKFQPAEIDSIYTLAPNSRRPEETLEIRVLGKATDDKMASVYLLVVSSDNMNAPWRPPGVATPIAYVVDSRGERFPLRVRASAAEIAPGEAAVIRAEYGRASDFSSLDVSKPWKEVTSGPIPVVR